MGLALGLAALLLAPAPSAPAEVVIAGEQIAYDRVFDRDADGDGKVDQRAYYLGEVMVAAAIDANHDGEMEAWLTFDESMRVRRVARDKDGDGAPEEAQNIGGDGRARGEPERLTGAPAIEERVLAPKLPPEPEPAA